MTVSKSLVFAASSALGLMFAGSAHGAIVYKYVAIQTSYTVAAGAQVTVNIYLNETVTSPSTSLLAPGNENGLAGAAFRLAEESNGLGSPSIITDVTFNNDAASNQFNGATFNVKSVTPTVATLSESNFFSAPGTGVELGNNPPLAQSTGVSTPSNDVFLGTATLTAGSTAGTTVFDLGRIGQSGSTVTNNNSYDLDSNSSSPAFTGVNNTISTISVTVTPEPASLGLVGLVSTLGLLARRKRLA
jgi:hypothetical protein